MDSWFKSGYGEYLKHKKPYQDLFNFIGLGDYFENQWDKAIVFANDILIHKMFMMNCINVIDKGVLRWDTNQ